MLQKTRPSRSAKTGRLRRMRDALTFLLQFVTQPTTTGAVAPSSSALNAALIEAARLHDARVIVQAGSGLGYCTQQIDATKPHDARLFVMEINPLFAEETRRNCPTATVEEGSVEHISTLLHEQGYAQCDCVISGLPWAAFTPLQQEQLLRSIREALTPGGRLVTFQYLHASHLPSARRFHRLLEQLFVDVRRTPTVWRNLPPAFVYAAHTPL